MLIVVYVVLCVLVGAYANSKGRSGVGFTLLALVISPLLGFLLALLFKGDPAKAEQRAMASGNQRKCPFCAELIKREATMCRFCGRDLQVAAASGN